MERMKRVISVLLVVVMVISASPLSVFAVNTDAAEDENTKKYDDFLYTVLEDGTISICGYEGERESDDEGVYLEIPSSIKGATVTQIAEEAFFYNDVIDTVVIPESVTSIGNSAFYHCVNLRAIAFRGEVPEFGFTVAEGSKKLEKVFTLKDSDIALFCSLLVNDLGEDGAKGVEIAEFEDIDELEAAYAEYTESLGGTLKANEAEEAALLEAESDEQSIATVAEVMTETETETGTESGTETETVEIVSEGTCGENLSWTLDANGVLTISGTGAMTDYSYSSKAPWYSDRNSIKSLVLDERVTAIGDYAFYSCGHMAADFSIFKNVTSIGNYAFRNCGELAGELVIPEGMTAIGDYTFYECYKLTGELKIPESVTSIGKYAFYYCNSLTGELVIPESVTSIGEGAFSCCTGFTGDLVIPESLTTIEKSAFSSCTGFTGKLVIPESVTSIGNYAFGYCDGFTGELKIPESVTTIGSGAFRECSGFTGELVIPKSITTIEDYTFYGCRGLTGSLVIPDNITGIGERAFGVCDGFTGSLVIPSSVKSIGNEAFRGCGGMTGELIISDGVTSIGSGAFQQTDFTGDLIIPDSVTYIDPEAFYNCEGFTGTLKLSANLTYIGSGAFEGCSGFTGALVIPDKLTEINRKAFGGMTGITSVVVGESVTSIYTSNYEHTFYGMTGVKRIIFKGITVPAGHSSDTYPTQYMTAMETIYVPEEAYDAYVTAWSGYVGDGVKFSSDLMEMGVENLSASNVYSKTIRLTWNEHVSGLVAGYKIERDGEIVGTTTDCAFTESGLTTGTTYKYSVYGYAEDGTTTGMAEIEVTPAAPVVSGMNTDSSLNKVGAKNTIYVQVVDNKNLDDFGEKTTTAKLWYVKGGERVLIGEAERDVLQSTATVALYTAKWDLGGVEDGKYDIIFAITDIDGTTTEYSKALTVDTSVPAQIPGLTAVAGETAIQLNWRISKEADTTIYRVYRREANDDAFVMLTQINDRNTLSYTDSSAAADGVYYYYVVGVNEFGQEGVVSELAMATLIDDTEAPLVTKITPEDGSYLTGTVKISVTAEDNVAVTKTELYYSVDDGENWTLLGEAESGYLKTTLDTTTIADGKIKIKGVATDAVGNVSDPLTNSYMTDNTGPEQVTGLSFESTDVTVTLSWSNVADEDIRYFSVEQKAEDGTYTKVTDSYSTLGANIYNLSPNTAYVYRVVGYDTHGNRGTPSEDITATTTGDVTAPVVTSIRPISGYYSESIDISVTAEDESNVRKLTIQTCTDGSTWKDVYAEEYTDSQTSRTLSYTLSLEDYPEGYLFVRAIAVDGEGNESDSSRNAPFVQHMVDKTAPAAPEGVAATGNCGYIEVSWTQGAEDDLGKYTVYRADAEDGTYTAIKTDIAAISYIDRDVEDGTVYYYKLAVNDTAGNMSEYSDAVSAEALEDTEMPTVVSIYPKTGSSISKEYDSMSALAKDNHALSAIIIEYSRDGETYSTMYESKDLNTYSTTAAAAIPTDELSDGDTVYIRVYAEDKAGNRSEALTAQYVMDAVAPTVGKASAVYEDGNVSISWTGNQESDLLGYSVYRKVGADGEYGLIAQISAEEGKSEYSCSDGSLALKETTYYYKVEAEDECGNTSSAETDAVTVPDRSAPEPVIYCDLTQEVDVEYYIDATFSTDDSEIVSYLLDFGDGTTSTEPKPVHVYSETGEYTITLTVTDDDGNISTCERTVTVTNPETLGTAKIRVVDENGAAVAGAAVYFNIGEPEQIIKTTDSNGYATFTAEFGKYSVGCIIADNEWLPAKKDIVITAGNETSVSMTMVHHTMIEGEFEVTRMTFDEIAAAGIDPTDPENQYMVTVTIKLNYVAEDEGDGIISFIYNEMTGETQCEGFRTYRYIVVGPQHISSKKSDRETLKKFQESEIDKGNYTFSTVEAVAFLEIPVDVATLKEFFSVRLHIINNASSKFSMTDNEITLDVPEGLSIVDSYASESEATVNIAEIKGQTTETVTWILRGDQVGSYYLSADYSGILSEFNEPVSASFVAQEPIKVYGLSNMKLTVEVADEMANGAVYYNVSLTNEGDIDAYCPKLETGDVLIETEMFNEEGANIQDKSAYYAWEVAESGIATSIDGLPDILPPGYRVTRHYMCKLVEYTEQKMVLQSYAYEMQNTYGLEVEIVVRPASYFLSNLSANLNAAEKAELTLTKNQSAFDYLMTNENYIYWSMYASTGSVSTALTSNMQEKLWDLLSVVTGDGDFKSLFGLDNIEQIQAIILDAMGITAEADDYSAYYAVFNWTKAIQLWLENEGHEEWLGIVAEWVGKALSSKVSKEMLADIVKFYGDKMASFFEIVCTSYRWEAYSAIIEGEMYDYDNFITEKFTVYVESYYSEVSQYIEQTKTSSMIHEMFSKKSFISVWEAVGIVKDIGTRIVSACEDTSADVSVIIAAQSNLESCNLFLDTIIDHMFDCTYEGKLIDGLPFTKTYSDINLTDFGMSDARKVVQAAQKIKTMINEQNYLLTLVDHLADEALWVSVGYAKKAFIKKLNLDPSALVTAIKVALKLTVFIGNSVFNVDDRHDIADNIRFVSCITIALRHGIWAAQDQYLNDKTDKKAANYMQLISYLLEIRAIGESQVAEFGMTYEVLEDVYENADLFYAVRDMSGLSGVRTWYSWRDYVEDRISMVRVQLFKNPLSTEASGKTAPVVTFNYKEGKTAQTFSSDYEYSLDGGGTWVACDGSAIAVAPQSYSSTIKVRRANRNDTTESMTGSVTVYAAPTLAGSGIRVLQTENGYRVENLDNDKNYEVTFVESAVSYKYGDSLETVIPNGSYSYEYVTDKTIGYVYIRSVADANQYASYVFRPVIYPMSEVSVTTEGKGSVAGAGSYEYGEEATFVATVGDGYEFGGWYEGDELLGSETTLTIAVYANRGITAKFTKIVAPWEIKTEAGIDGGYVTGILAGATAEELTEYFATDDGTEVTVTKADGGAVTKVGTGCLLHVGDATYTIVVLGDIDGDGEVKANDITKLKAAYLGKTNLTDAQNMAGDIDGLNGVQASDVTKLKAAYLGKTTLEWAVSSAG